MHKIRSANFDFLETHSDQLVWLGSLAERYFSDDPNTCLIKLRQFAELLAQMVAARMGRYEEPVENFADLLQRLSGQSVFLCVPWRCENVQPNRMDG